MHRRLLWNHRLLGQSDCLLKRWLTQSSDEFRCGSGRDFAEILDVGQRSGHSDELMLKRKIGQLVDTFGLLLEVSVDSARLGSCQWLQVLSKVHAFLLKNGQFLLKCTRKVVLRGGRNVLLNGATEIFPSEGCKEFSIGTAALASFLRACSCLVLKCGLCTCRARSPREQARLYNNLGFTAPRVRFVNTCVCPYDTT